MEVSVTVNGKSHTHDVEPRTLLVHHIRDNLGLTGTNVGCDSSSCGACTVHMDGASVKSCTVLAVQASGAEITTIEGVGDKVAETIQQVWADFDVPQCGYCQSGQIMSAVALLNESPKPTDEEINDAMAGNLCRCATYQRIRGAIHEAAKRLEA